MDANTLEEQKERLGSRLMTYRESCEKSLARSAEQLGVSAKVIKNFESGQSTPSLPQLELLAELYRIPVENLLNNEPILSRQTTLAADKVADFIEIRNKIIAATIKQQRLTQKLTLKKLASAVGISSGMLSKYESAETAIPEPVLEGLCSQLGIPLKSLYSPLSGQTREVHTTASLDLDSSQVSGELLSFIQNPANLPYLELAKRLSGMDAAKLRAIAEDLLEITY